MGIPGREVAGIEGLDIVVGGGVRLFGCACVWIGAALEIARAFDIPDCVVRSTRCWQKGGWRRSQLVLLVDRCWVRRNCCCVLMKAA
jgi:hypothetical protein